MLLEDSGLLYKRPLKLSWLRIEPVIVLPFLLHLDLLIPRDGNTSHECKPLDRPDVVVHSLLTWLVHQVDLTALKSSWDSEDC